MSYETKEFKIWAFGEELSNTRNTYAMERWNEIHSDLFILKGDECVKSFLVRMYEEYNKYLNKEYDKIGKEEENFKSRTVNVTITAEAKCGRELDKQISWAIDRGADLVDIIILPTNKGGYLIEASLYGDAAEKAIGNSKINQHQKP